MIIFNKLDNYFVVSANSQTFLGFEMTANFRDTSPLTTSGVLFCDSPNRIKSLETCFIYHSTQQAKLIDCTTCESGAGDYTEVIVQASL